MMTSAEGRLMNNKLIGPLVLIRPDWDEDTRALTLTFPDGATVTGEVQLAAEAEQDLYAVPFPSRPVLGPWQAALSTSRASRSASGGPITAQPTAGSPAAWLRSSPRGSLARIGDVAHTGLSSTVAASACCSRSTVSPR